MRRGFSNWIACLTRLLAWRFLSARVAPLLWRSRHGTVILTPHYTWFSAVECFGYDSYRLVSLPREYPLRWFLDIGAHIGTFALALLERWPEARGIACEPSAESFVALTENLQRNARSESCECLRAAVVGQEGLRSVSFHYRPLSPSTSTSLPVEKRGAEAVVTVPAVCFAELIRRVPRVVDLVKIDVEGAEYEIIERTPLELLSRVKLLVLEYHHVAGRSPDELVSRLARAGLPLRRHGAPLMWFGNWPGLHQRG